MCVNSNISIEKYLNSSHRVIWLHKDTKGTTPFIYICSPNDICLVVQQMQINFDSRLCLIDDYCLDLDL